MTATTPLLKDFDPYISHASFRPIFRKEDQTVDTLAQTHLLSLPPSPAKQAFSAQHKKDPRRFICYSKDSASPIFTASIAVAQNGNLFSQYLLSQRDSGNEDLKLVMAYPPEISKKNLEIWEKLHRGEAISETLTIEEIHSLYLWSYQVKDKDLAAHLLVSLMSSEDPSVVEFIFGELYCSDLIGYFDQTAHGTFPLFWQNPWKIEYALNTVKTWAERDNIHAMIHLAFYYQKVVKADPSNREALIASEKVANLFRAPHKKEELLSLSVDELFVGLDCYAWIFPNSNQSPIPNDWLNESKTLAKVYTLLGYCHDIGIGTPKRWETANFFYWKAADLNETQAEYMVAASYWDSDQPALGFNWALKAASKGHPKALCLLGDYYAEGIGTPKSQEQAFECYEKAALRGLPEAQHNAGVFLVQRFVAGSEKKGFEWHLRAARQNFAPAQNSLGFSYHFAIGTEKDEDKAFYWYSQAAAQKHLPALNNLGVCFELGIGTDRAPQKAVDAYLQAASSGLSSAQAKLSACYRDGVGVEQNRELAIEWAQKGAANGHPEAIDLLALLTPKDPAVIAILQKRAAQKDCAAMSNLAFFHENGIHVDQNLERAAQLRQDADDHKEVRGVIYREVPYPDVSVFQKLKNWFRKRI